MRSGSRLACSVLAEDANEVWTIRPDFKEANMGIARFFVVDSYQPKATRDEVDALLSKMDGVTDWRFHPDGEVVVEYGSNRISDEMIETALEGVGYSLMHISDDPRVAGHDADEALSQAC
jgi:copper chaperone CopZ